MTDILLQSLSLRSRLTPGGAIRLSLEPQDIRPPGGDEVVLRMEAAPVNPTDLNLLLAGGDPALARQDAEAIEIALPAPLAQLNHRRLNLSVAPGLEGAGVVIAAGPQSEALIGQTAAVFGGAAFGQHRLARPRDCIFFGAGFPASEAASSFVNPMTALCMIDTMRRDGHRAIVHTAAASSLGRMLERLCAEEGIPLINILRSAASRDAVLAEGARYALDSSDPGFHHALAALVAQTDASLAFDAIGGGTLAARIMAAMEEVFAPPPEAYDIYGSRRLKQVCIYGGLTPGAIEIPRGFGSAWSVSGWLMMNHMATLSPEKIDSFRARVRGGIRGVFRTSYAEEITLQDLLNPARLSEIRRLSGGRKVLLRM
ncbi:MDR/zinc-dependent alcohol dehydrogenase-like family protein [Falsigemmobacter faecalis]|uniref:NADH oxidase n=1 Tax=Falsigemmobacter faecalis TaxID=2488730 RepID=A0A3P3DK61_9RHOB|nr:NADH oxidase [Falsigemmobacter faecalis]RRH72998.1 NADH oxidase [Falsigemmobacter faecalis]